MKRREAREQAFILAFEQTINNDSIQHIIDAAGISRDLIADEFVEKLAQGVEDHREELDEIISQYIRGWKMNRLSKTALTILRMAVYEIRFEKDIPAQVSANEAVELAKKYGASEDSAFINGVLASVILAENGEESHEQP